MIRRSSRYGNTVLQSVVVFIVEVIYLYLYLLFMPDIKRR